MTAPREAKKVQLKIQDAILGAEDANVVTPRPKL